MKHIAYPKIQQFRNIVDIIKRESCFEGFDENNEPVYNNLKPKPVITFKGTIKLHGTNAAVCHSEKDGIWYQSRENIITPEKDNAGFAFFAESHKDVFEKLFDHIKKCFTLNQNRIITIYGEWAGKGIQKGVGISELDKAFYIFGVKVSYSDETIFSYWLPSNLKIEAPESKIFNIENFQTFYLDIDFNNPQLSQNRLIEITEQVEKECPVAKYFGIENGLGEGVVWSCKFNENTHRFKVKGEKHSVSKVKKLASVDVEQLKKIEDFVEYAVTENRFNQSLEKIFEGGDVDIKKLGDVIRWVINDIISEEMDVLAKNNLEPKNVNSEISKKVRQMFFELV